jgi:hypothetical protein
MYKTHFVSIDIWFIKKIDRIIQWNRVWGNVSWLIDIELVGGRITIRS